MGLIGGTASLDRRSLRAWDDSERDEEDNAGRIVDGVGNDSEQQNTTQITRIITDKT
jgi:hypothetical protein